MTSKELLDYLLENNALTPDALNEFIAENPDEDQYFDYKNGIITFRANRADGIQTIRRYTSGFANSSGGILIIGVGEDSPRQVSGCEQRPGGQSLDQWASRCLHDMAAYFSPPPRFQVIEHPAGHILTISVSRSPLLVPCVEARELKYFVRIGDSTLQAPEYLIADLVLGRRQIPILDVKPLPINGGRKDFSDETIRRVFATKSVTFSFRIENSSLLDADNIRMGIVLWSLEIRDKENINRNLLSYIDKVDIKSQNDSTSQFSLVHHSNVTSRKPFHLAPFEQCEIHSIGPFYFPLQISAKILGALYIMAKNTQPTWYQLEFGYWYSWNAPTTQEQWPLTLTRKGGERPEVAWIEE